MATKSLVRHNIINVSQCRRLPPALTAIPPLWGIRYFTTSLDRAQSGQEDQRDDFPGAVRGGSAVPEVSLQGVEARLELVKPDESFASEPAPLIVDGHVGPPAVTTGHSPSEQEHLREAPMSSGAVDVEPKVVDLVRKVFAPIDETIRMGGIRQGPRPEAARPFSLARRPSIAPGTKEYFRFARIFGLSADMTLADVLAGIAATAPVGRVLDISWDRPNRIVRRSGRDVRGAFVLFDHDAAPVDLVRLARQRTFRVRGEVLHVSVWTQRPFHGNTVAENSSRVLCLRGPRDVEGFSEEGIRELLMGNANVVKALGPLGLDAEAVKTTDWGGGQRLIEWRFFSNEKQCRVVFPIVRRYFYKELTIGYGRDPCWDEKVYPRQRMSSHKIRQLSGIAEALRAPNPRRRHRGDEGNTLPREVMVKWSPEEYDQGHDELDNSGDPSQRSSKEQAQTHWVDIKHDIPYAHADGRTPGEQDSLRWEGITNNPSDGRTEDDLYWDDEDFSPKETDTGPTPDHVQEFMASFQVKEKPKKLGSEQKERVGQWMRLQRSIEGRPRPKNKKEEKSTSTSIHSEDSFERAFRS
ncbi:unnamed protein product [Discula destructiva]